MNIVLSFFGIVGLLCVCAAILNTFPKFMANLVIGVGIILLILFVMLIRALVVSSAG